MSSFTTAESQIEALYIGYFGRAGDPSGMDYWIGRYESGMSLASIAASFSVQVEATNAYPFLANPLLATPTSAGAFINSVFEDLFNRPENATNDPVGFTTYWLPRVEAAAASSNPQAIGQIIQDIISGATGADNTTLQNKVAVGDFFTNEFAANNTPYAGAAITLSQSIIAGTTSVSSTVTTEDTAVTTFLAAPPPIITTYDLTTALDTNHSIGAGATITAGQEVVGTIGYEGYYYNTNTLNPGDTLVFNGGTLQIADQGGYYDSENPEVNYNELTGVSITGPFNFVVVENGYYDGVFDFTANNSVTSVTALNSSQYTYFEDLPNGTAVIASGANQTSDVYFSMINPTAAVSVGVNGGVSGVDIEYYEFGSGGSGPYGYGNDTGAATSATISSTGAANGFGSAGYDYFELTHSGASITSLTIDASTNLKAYLESSDYASAGATLTVSGAATLVDLTSSTSSDIPFTSINASGLTGGALLIYADSMLKTFTGGGAGGNELLFDGTDYLSAGATAINGGGGTGNILSAQFVDIGNAGIFTNWQILDVTAADFVPGSPFDANIMTADTITGVQFTGSDITVGGENILNLAPAATVLVTNPGGSDVSISGLVVTHSSATGDNLAVTFNDTKGSLDQFMTFLTSTGDATVTIASNAAGSATGGYNEVAQLIETNNVLTTVTITGNQFLYMGDNHNNPNSDAVVTDFGVTGVTGAAGTVASSLTLIDASATTSGVDIEAGASNVITTDFENGHAFSTTNTYTGAIVTYTGLTIKGGSGNGDYIENDAKSGVIIDGNGAGDGVDLGSSGGTATVGTGANDLAYVGSGDLVGILAAGKGLGNTVTFGAGASAELYLATGAEAGSTSTTNTYGQTTVHGAAAGTLISFVGGAGGGTDPGGTVIYNATSSVALATSLANAADLAVAAMASAGVAWFNYGTNEYLVATAASETHVSATDTVVELVGVNTLGHTLAAGVVTL
jgi:hypothetical protein